MTKNGQEHSGGEPCKDAGSVSLEPWSGSGGRRMGKGQFLTLGSPGVTAGGQLARRWSCPTAVCGVTGQPSQLSVLSLRGRRAGCEEGGAPPVSGQSSSSPLGNADWSCGDAR